jgi:hypothetical protein
MHKHAFFPLQNWMWRHFMSPKRWQTTVQRPKTRINVKYLFRGSSAFSTLHKELFYRAFTPKQGSNYAHWFQRTMSSVHKETVPGVTSKQEDGVSNVQQTFANESTLTRISGNPDRSMKGEKSCSQTNTYFKRHVSIRKADESLVCADKAGHTFFKLTLLRSKTSSTSESSFDKQMHCLFIVVWVKAPESYFVTRTYFHKLYACH